MQHIYLTCKNHPNLRWHTKSIAVNPSGSYNGMRHIFYEGLNDGQNWPKECPCPPSDLIFASEEEKKKWEEDHAEV